MQATIQINHDLSSKFEEINENERTYEQREDESLGMLLEGINSTKFEIQQHLDTEKSTVSQIMESELGHDVPTGKTFLQLCVCGQLYFNLPSSVLFPFFFRSDSCQKISWFDP